MFDDGYQHPEGDDYLLNIEATCAPVASLDPSHSEQQLVLYLDSDNLLRVTPFGANAAGAIEETLSHSGPFIFRGGVLQRGSEPGSFSDAAIDRFESLINAGIATEQDFQSFFQAHPEFLQALDYGPIHAQPVLYKDDGSKMIPDFFLEKLDCSWHAIAELKKPLDRMVVRRKNRIYFSQWLQDAIAQLHYYREWFESKVNRETFERTQGLSSHAYKPKMVLVAGRKASFLDDVERMRLLTAQDANLILWTYDDLLERAKKYKAFVKGCRQEL